MRYDGMWRVVLVRVRVDGHFRQWRCSICRRLHAGGLSWRRRMDTERMSRRRGGGVVRMADHGMWV